MSERVPPLPPTGSSIAMVTHRLEEIACAIQRTVQRKKAAAAAEDLLLDSGRALLDDTLAVGRACEGGSAVGTQHPLRSPRAAGRRRPSRPWHPHLRLRPTRAEAGACRSCRLRRPPARRANRDGRDRAPSHVRGWRSCATRCPIRLRGSRRRYQTAPRHARCNRL